MKLFTMQHKDVLNSVGRYYPNVISNYHHHTPNCYKNLCDELYRQTGEVSNIPVFTWRQVFIDTELRVDMEHLLRMNEMTPVPPDRVLLVLEVPDSVVLTTSFYDFVDARCIEEFEEVIENFTWDNVYYNLEGIDELQAILPYIDMKWVQEVYTFTGGLGQPPTIICDRRE